MPIEPLYTINSYNISVPSNQSSIVPPSSLISENTSSSSLPYSYLSPAAPGKFIINGETASMISIPSSIFTLSTLQGSFIPTEISTVISLPSFINKSTAPQESIVQSEPLLENESDQQQSETSSNAQSTVSSN